MTANPWFKLYSRIMTDPKVEFLSFEDQRHFVWILCLKNEGYLDEVLPNDALRERMIARKLGLQGEAFEQAKNRLLESGLIDEDWHPVGWDRLQVRSKDYRNSLRPDGESLEGDYRGYVYFIGSKSGSQVKIGYSKNPWARVRELQTATTEQLRVLATVTTTEPTEITTHEAFAELRISGEWFRRTDEIDCLINDIRMKKVKTANDVVSYRSSYVATTKEEDKEEDKEFTHTGGGVYACVCPVDFEPDPGWEAQVKIPLGFDYEFQLSRFKNHEFSSPVSDWQRAWRNWVPLSRSAPASGMHARIPQADYVDAMLKTPQALGGN